MEALGLTLEMTIVLGVLGLTIFLFVSEIVRVDVAAVIIMVLLGGLASLPGLESLVDVRHLFDGFASNAVISIIAVMIIGAGLDKTGVMSVVATWITRYGGETEPRLIPMISGTVGVISSFMQNVGAAALFLPVVSRISTKTGLPMSRLLMPMGFCAILGGTMTMVGSSPLILLNDLIVGINGSLAADKKMETFELFAVAPIGLALIATGILYFVVFGRLVLPGAAGESGDSAQNLLEYFDNIYGFDGGLHEIDVPEGSSLEGLSLDGLEVDHHIQIIATGYHSKTFLEPPRDTVIQTPCRLAVIADRASLNAFMDEFGLSEMPELDRFPTHQVNALIMGPAGYRVADFVRAGSIMTILFLAVSLAMLNLAY
ncbi:MAG: SLC13 family permease [Magnetovibrio sp.]|nr:SLC13 family permease [Magnetovibrio sp.]